MRWVLIIKSMIDQARKKDSEKILFLGASRGLGAATLELVRQSLPQVQTLLMSRRPQEFQGQSMVANFSKPEDQKKVLEVLSEFQPTRIFYFAGGGPFGPLQEKEWKDHQWALDVSLLFPAQLIHRCLQTPQNLKQMIFIGSSVAETKPDPFAASYAMAKHGLLGLISSLQGEALNLDLRLFSPHYMDTELLPKNAWPRQNVGLWKVEEVAKLFCHWVFEEKNPAGSNWHKTLESKKLDIKISEDM
ncbi:MAG: hypothetical protein AB7F59_02210 [Bdellovibrionales bacterium]